MMMPIDEKTEAKCKKELQVYLDKISLLEKENQELRQEVNRLRSQVNALKAHDLERKSILWKKLQNSMVPSLLPHDQDQDPFKIKLSAAAAAPKEEKAAAAAAAKLPVRSILVGGHKELGNGNCNKLESKSKMEGATPPPPPPPPPSKLLLSRSAAALCRVPEVMEFYRSLMKKRDAHAHALAQHHKDKRISSGSMGNPKNMIGEIENRSSYLFNVSVYLLRVQFSFIFCILLESIEMPVKGSGFVMPKIRLLIKGSRKNLYFSLTFLEVEILNQADPTRI